MTANLSNRIRWSSRIGGLDSTNTSRSTPYLAAKANGDNRMAVKRELPEDVYGKVPQDLSDMVKAELPESQYPVTQSHVSRLQHLQCGTTSITVGFHSAGNLPVGGRWGMTPFKDTNEIPKSLYRLIVGNAGWPTGRESYGHGDPIVVRGRESRPHAGQYTNTRPDSGHRGNNKGTTNRAEYPDDTNTNHNVMQGKAGQVSTIPERGGTRDA